MWFLIDSLISAIVNTGLIVFFIVLAISTTIGLIEIALLAPVPVFLLINAVGFAVIKRTSQAISQAEIARVLAIMVNDRRVLAVENIYDQISFNRRISPHNQENDFDTIENRLRKISDDIVAFERRYGCMTTTDSSMNLHIVLEDNEIHM
jgi:hypothetical protein